MSYSIGLDYGTNSVRALIVDTRNGAEIATSVWAYAHGRDGIVLDERKPDLARQHPQDYLDGAVHSITAALDAAKRAVAGFAADQIIGIGIDTTGSTPIPVDAEGRPLALRSEFAADPAALAWLWKDHTSFAEAAAITAAAARVRPQYLAKCGGTYSSEWFWAKIWHCRATAPTVFDAAYTWVECADWLPATLTGSEHPAGLKRSICAAGHKAMFNPAWGGYPDAEFLAALDPALVRVRETLPNTAYSVADAVGRLTADWAAKTGLPAGIPVAAGAFDAHLGGIGSGIRKGTLVKIIGTSTCDLMTVPMDETMPDIPGLCGIVPGSIRPDSFGLEAGQSAVGDIFNWFVQYIQPGGPQTGGHQALTEQAEALSPGSSGLLVLDWHNGNRTVLVDQRLSGCIVGLSLHTRPEEIYRALIEATAFGSRVIMERFEEYGQTVEQIVNCGGISAKNRLAMQIYADIMNRPLRISRSNETCALGSAIAGAVVAGAAAGGYDDFDGAMAAMTGTLDTVFLPDPEHVAVYDRLYRLYRRLHDAFGTPQSGVDLYPVMKELLAIRDEVRR